MSRRAFNYATVANTAIWTLLILIFGRLVR
jgi:hypothetical protein